MKKHIFYPLIAAAVLSFNSCLNNDFLEYNPLSTQVEATAFTTYDNFKTYSWGLYSKLFLDGTLDDALGNQVYGYPGPYDRNGDDGMFQSGVKPRWAWQTATVSVDGKWNFELIRQTNVMLDNIDGSQMNDADKDHWRAVGYFFRAYRYAQLIANFGDVPWAEHVIGSSDRDMIYGPRTPRDEVAQKVLDNLLWAETHIKQDGEGAGSNSVNVHVIRALISRFGLAEGTWRKYHQLGGHEQYLDACIAASKKVMDAYPAVSSEYDALYNSESLEGVPGILLYRAFGTGQLYHNMSRYERTSSADTEMSKECVAGYLTQNGLPVSNVNNQVANGGQYYGDETMYDEFRNRDRRLLYVVTPPFKVKGLVSANQPIAPYLTTNDTYGAANKPVTSSDSIMFSEYVEYMKGITSTARTTGIQFPAGITYVNLLPIRNWEGNALQAVPHFNKYNEGRGFCVTRGGYFVYKYYNTSTAPNGQISTNDIPVFRVEETMLNYAEAMWERGMFDQGVADLTINKLRPRAGVASMVVGNINANFDPERDKGGYSDTGNPLQIADYEVDPVLWEIRRERRVELMGDGFRFDDLKRWRKGHYLNKVQLGVTVDNSDYNNTLAIWPYDKDEGAKSSNSDNKIGPVALFGDPVAEGKGWKWYYYLYPISPTQLALNPQLTQNPGWAND